MKLSAQATKRFSAYLFSALLAFNPLLTSAQIVVDDSADASRRATLDHAANGVDIVNIAEASDRGVSHNQFTEFNVDTSGVILNNSRGIVNTELGGYINGNANLGSGEARIILNEVTSNNRSSLQGYTEIAGQSAEYVLANPYGITCNGCGFINTPKVTLATGTPEMANGDLHSLKISGGDLVVEGLGLNASNVNHVDILTRAARINAAVHAQSLRIVTGPNLIDYASGRATTIAAEDSAKPLFGLDVSLLGGMYANAITLQGTEHGVGVRAAGDMAANAGDFIVTATGDVVLNNASASERMVISTTQNLVAEGTLHADSVHASAGQDINLTGERVSAERQISLRANNIVSISEVAAGYGSAGSAIESGLLNLSANTSIDNSGHLISTGRTSLVADTLTNRTDAIIQSQDSINAQVDNLSNRGALIASGGTVELDVQGVMDNVGGAVSANDNVDINVGNLLLNTDGSISGANGGNVSVTGEINNENAEIVFEQGSLLLELGSLNNRSGRIHHSGDGIFDLNIVEDFDNTSGSLWTTGSLDVSADNILNDQGYIFADQSISLQAQNELNNNAGHIGARANANLLAANLNNRLGVIAAETVATEATAVNNSGGSIEGNAVALRVSGDFINDQSGLISALGIGTDALILLVDGHLDNSGGRIQTNAENFDITTGDLSNRSGTILHAGSDSMTISVQGNADNSDGVIRTQGSLSITAADILNSDGLIHSTRALGLAAAELDNSSGRILANGGSEFTIDVTNRLNNASGLLHGEANTVRVAASSIDNTDGQILQAGTGGLRVSGAVLENTHGTIAADSGLQLEVDAVSNVLGEIHGTTVAVEADEFVNDGGTIEAGSTLTISVSGDLTNGARDGEAGLISALGNTFNALLIEVDRHFDNSGGVAQTNAQGFRIVAEHVSNRSGQIIHTGDDSISITAGLVDNAQGSLLSEGNLLVAAGDLDNTAGIIAARGAGDTRVVLANALSNEGGVIRSHAATTVVDANIIANVQGELLQAGNGNLDIKSVLVDNTGGLIAGNQRINVKADAVSNLGGGIQASAIAIDAGDVDNSGGVIEAETVDLSIVNDLINGSFLERAGLVSALGSSIDALQLNVSAHLDNSGTIQTNAESLAINSGRISNTEGTIVHAGSGVLTLAAQAEIDNNDGFIQSNGNIVLSATQLTNNAGTLSTGGALQASLHGDESIVSNRGGLIRSGSSLGLTANDMDNTGGTITTLGGATATIAIRDTLANQNGVIQSRAATTTITASAINNNYGQVLQAGSGALAIAAESVQNNGGRLTGNGELQLDADVIDNTLGELSSSSMDVQAVELVNDGGLIEADIVDLDVAANFSNGIAEGEAGLVSALSKTADSLAVNVGQHLDNSGGVIQTNASSFRVQSDKFDNAEGKVIHAGEGVFTLVVQDAVNNADGIMHSAGSVSVAGENVDNARGLIRGARGIAVTTVGALENNSGVLESDQSLLINAATLDNNDGAIINRGQRNTEITVAGHLANDQGVIQSNANLTMTADSLSNNAGRVLHGGTGEAVIAMGDELNNTAGEIGSNGILAFSADGIVNVDGEIYATSLTVDGEDIDNSGGLLEGEVVSLSIGNSLINNATTSGAGVISALGTAADSLNLNIGGLFDNARGITQSNAHALTVTAASFTNNNGQFIHAGTGILTLDVQNALLNLAGQIDTNGGLVLSAANLDNSDGLIGSVQNMQISLAASGALTNTEGLLDSSGSVLLLAHTLDNSRGIITSAGTEAANIAVTERIVNDAGLIQTNSTNMQIATQELDNRGGHILHAGTGELTVHAQTMTNNDGVLASNNALALEASHTDNSHGEIFAADIAVTGGSLTNDVGVIEAGQLSLTLSGDLSNGKYGDQKGVISALDSDANALAITLGGHLDNSGVIQTNASDAAVSVGSLGNRGGRVIHGGDGVLELNVQGQIDNSGGLIDSRGALGVNSAELVNELGLLGALTDINIAVDNRLSNTAGVLDAGGTISVTAATLDNTGGDITSAGVDAGQTTTMNVLGVLDNTDGIIQTNNDTLQLIANQITNERGNILHAGNAAVTVNANSLDNSYGVLAGNSQLVITVADMLNDLGEVYGNNVSIAGADFTNIAGILEASTIHLALTGDLVNGASDATQGVISALGSGFNALLLDVDGSLNNSGGVIQTNAEDLSLEVGSFVNRTGQFIHAGQGTLNINVANALSNANGVLESNGSIKGTANSLDNSLGFLAASGDVNLTIVGDADNSNGVIDALSSINLSSANLANDKGIITSAGTEAAQIMVVGAIDNTDGRLQSNGDSFTVNAESINNTQGAILHGGDQTLAINVNGELVNDQGEIASNASVELTVDSLNNDSGQIFANTVAVTGVDVSNNGGLLEADVVQLNLTGDLTNGAESGNSGIISALSNSFNALLLNVSGHYDNSGGITQTRSEGFTLTAQSFTNHSGNLLHSGSGVLRLDISESLDNSQGYLSTAGQLSVTAVNVINQSGELTASGQASFDIDGTLDNATGIIDSGANLSISAADVQNAGGTLLGAGIDDSAFVVTGDLNNSGGQILSNAAEFSIQAGILINNAAGEITHAGDYLNLTIDNAFVNNGGQVASAGDLAVVSQEIYNQGGEIFANHLTLTGANLQNSGGLLEGDRVALDLTGNLTNGVYGAHGGLIVALSNSFNALALSVDGQLDNSGGALETRASGLEIALGSFRNDAGHLIHAGAGELTINASADWDNSGGMVDTDGTINLQAANILNREGVMVASGDMTLTASAALNNRSGSLDTAQDLTLNAQELDNSAGTIISSGTGSTRLDVATTFDNSDGLLISNSNDLVIETGQLLNLSTGGSTGGRIHHAGSGSLVIGSDQLSNSGEIAGANAVVIAGSASSPQPAAVVTNIGGVIFGDALSIFSQQIENIDGGILEGDEVALSAEGALSNNSGGVISAFNAEANAALAITAGNFDNSGGTTQTNAVDADIKVREFRNDGGALIHAGSGILTLDAGGAWNNAGGRIDSGGNVILTATSVTNSNRGNASAGILASGDITFSIDSFIDNANGYLDSGNILTLSAESLTNTNGVIYSIGSDNSEWTIIDTLNNTDGQILSNANRFVINVGSLINSGENAAIHHAGSDQLDIAAIGSVANQSGDIASASEIALSAESVTNADNGSIFAQAVRVNTPILSNSGGAVIEAADLQLNISEAINNTDGGVLSAYDDATGPAANGVLSVTTDQFDNSGGVVRTNLADAELTVDTFINAGGYIYHSGTGALTLTTNSPFTNAGGFIDTAGSLSLTALSLDNQLGQIMGQLGLTIATTGDLVNTGGLLDTAGALTLSAQNLHNAEGEIIAAGAADGVISVFDAIDNTDGAIIARSNRLTLTADVLVNSGQDSLINHSGDSRLYLNIAENIDNTGGQIGSSSETRLGADSATVTSTSLTVNNAGGALFANALDLVAADVTNTDGNIQAADIDLNVSGDLVNDNGGYITALDNGAGGSLALEVAGHFNNSGGTTQSNTTNLQINAGQVSNTAGQIKHDGAGTLTLMVDNTLANTGNGSIIARGSLLATAQSINNTDGDMVALNRATITSNTNVTNTRGLIEAGNGLHLAANGGQLINQQGNIHSFGNSSATISATGGLNNTGGSIYVFGGGQAFTLNAATQLNNTDGSILHGGSGRFTIAAGTINNRTVSGSRSTEGETTGALIGSNGTLVIDDFATIVNQSSNAGLTSVLNADHLELTSNRANARVTNTGGVLYAGGANSMVLDVATIDNRNGLVTSFGDVNLTTNSLLNGSGSVQSQEDVILNLPSFNLSNGALNAGGRLVINTSGNVINNSGNELLAAGGLTINTTGNFTNYGTVSTGGDISLASASADFTNAAGASITAGQDLFLTFDQYVNRGLMTANRNLSLTGKSLTNHAIMASGQNFTASLSNGITNNNLLFAGDSMALYGGTDVANNRDANIFAVNNIVIAANDSNDHLQSFENISANVEAYNGSLLIFASDIKNRMETLIVTPAESDPDPEVKDPVHHGDSYGSVQTTVFVTEYLAEVVEVSPEAQLLAGKNVELRGGDILNQFSTIAAGEYVVISGSNLDNQTFEVEGKQVVKVITRTYSGCPSCWLVDEKETNGVQLFLQEIFDALIMAGLGVSGSLSGTISNTAINIDDYRHNRIQDTSAQGGVAPTQDELTFSGAQQTSVASTVDGENFTTTSADSAAGSSKVDSVGGTVSQAATQSGSAAANQSASTSISAAVSSSTSNTVGGGGRQVDTVTSNSSTDEIREVRTSVTGVVSQHTAASAVNGSSGKVAQVQSNGGTQEGVVGNTTVVNVASTGSGAANVTGTRTGVVIENGTANDVVITGESDGVIDEPKGIDAASIAGTTVPITDDDGAVTSVTPRSGEPIADIGDEGSGELAPAVPVEGNGPPALGGGADVEVVEIYNPVDQLTLPQDKGLFVISPEPEAHYLVETNPILTDYLSFISSDYMLDQLGFDPNDLVKRLGDGFYETQLVREAIWNTRGQRFLSDTQGVAFTSDADQFQYLMENAVAASRDMNLTPGIALTKEQVDRLTSDIVWLEEKRVQGQTVLVPVYYATTANGTNFHNGAVIAATDINLHAGQGFNNTGTISGTGQVALSTQQSFTNTGLVTGDFGVSIDAAEITNQRLSQRQQGTIESEQGWVGLRANTGDIANVDGTLRGQNISLESLEGSIANSGRIMSERDVVAIVRRDISNSIDGTAGSISAGRDLAMQAREGSILNNARISSREAPNYSITYVGRGPELTAGRDMALSAGTDIEITASRVEAGRDLTADAGRDIRITSAANERRFHSTSGNYQHTKETVDQVSSAIRAGGNLALGAGRDVQLIGSTANAGGNIAVDAGRDLHIETVANRYHSDVGTKSNKTIETTVRHVDTGFTAGGNVVAHAERDINLVGSTIDAQGNIALNAERDTNLVAVNDSSYDYYIKTKKRSFGRKKVTVTETRTETAVGGNIRAGGDVLINARKAGDVLITENSANVNIVGGAIEAGKDVVVSADEDITITGSTYRTLDYHNTSKKGFGGLSSKTKGAVQDDINLHAASVTAQGDLTLVSGDDVSMAGVDIVVGGDVNMEAVDELLLNAGEVITQSESWSKSSGLFTGGSLYSSSEKREGEGVTAAQASNITAGGTVTGRAGTTQIIGSNIHGEQGVDISSDIGDTVITTAVTTRDSYSYEKEMAVSLGGALDTLTRPDQIVQNDDGRLKVTLASASYDKVETTTHETEMTSSNITSGGDVALASEENVRIEGSSLAADLNQDGTGDISLTANKDVTIKEATELFEQETKETHGDAEVSFVVQHQAAEVAKAAIAVKEAGEKLEQAKKDYKQYERDLDNLRNTLTALEADYENQTPGVSYDDILELREIVEDVEGDKDWYVAGVTLAAANVAAASTALAQQTAAAAASTATYGFNAGVQLDIDATKSKETIKQTTSVASNVTGQNITIRTGGGNTAIEDTTTTLQGSHLQAADKISISTGDLDILASRDKLETESETEHGHLTAQVTVYGAAGGASLSGSYDRSKSSTSQTTYNNSTLTADNIDLTTTGDTTIRGGNVHADSQLTADIGGDLNVESVQNRSRSKNNAMGISGGVGFGGNGSESGWQGAGDVGDMSSVNGGLNASNGMSSTKETVLSSLTSGGTADIKVGDNTQITGAVIATIDGEGNDLGQLNLETDSLTFTDLKNINISSQQSAGISSNVMIGGASATQAAEGQPIAQDTEGRTLRPGTSNITYSNTSHNEASKALATLGSGNITVGGTQLEHAGEVTEAGAAEGSALTSLNRDTTNTTKELWSVDRQEGNVDLQIDHRMFSEEGRKEIKENFVDTKEFGGDIAYATQEASKDEHLGITDFWTTLDNTAKGTQLKNELLRDPNNAHIVEGLKSGDAEQYAQAVADLGHLAQTKFGLELSDINLYDAGVTDSLSLENNLIYDRKGGIVTEEGHAQYGDIFINAEEGETKTGMVNTLGHEVIESQTLQTGGVNDDAQEAQANIFGNHFSNRINQAAGGDLDNTGGPNFSSNLANSQAVHQGTQLANDVGSAQVDHRQLRGPEMEAISLAAKRMAVAEGISEQQAEQRLAVELLDHLDASWNAKHQQEGRETDSVALEYLAESLADMGDAYRPYQPGDDIPLPPGEEPPPPNYSSEQVKTWLQNYGETHADSYQDRTLFAEDLAAPFSEMQQFYDTNLREQMTLKDHFDSELGEIAAVGSIVNDTVLGVDYLLHNPIQGAEAIAKDMEYLIFNPFGYVGDVLERKDEAELNAILNSYQGDHYNAALEGTKGSLEFGLEVLGAIPAGKPALIKKLDNIAPEINPNLLADPSYGVKAGDVAERPLLEWTSIASDSVEPITDPRRLLEHKTGSIPQRPDFYVKSDGTAVPGTGYRHVASDAPYIGELKETGLTPPNASGNYFTFDQYNESNEAASKLQVPHDARIRIEFDTKQVLEDVTVPKGKWGTADYLEPLTKDFPEFGEGDATQAITHKEIQADKVKDLKSGETIYER